MRFNLILSLLNVVIIEMSKQQTNHVYWSILSCSNLYLFFYFLSDYCNVIFTMTRKTNIWRLNYILGK